MTHLHLSTAVLAACLATGCLATDDADVGTTEQYGIYGQGIYGQGIYGQGIYGQGIYGQGIYGQGVSADGSSSGFDGTINGAQFASNMVTAKGAPLTNVRIVGSELRATLNGTELRGTQLRGARWTSNNLVFRINAVRVRQADTTMVPLGLRSNADAWEYELQWRRNMRFSTFQKVCNESPDGDRYATLVPGSWDTSRHYSADGDITVGCSAGTIHKCAFVWGYKRWKRAFPPARPRTTRVSLAPLHSACVYAASASLCDSGQAHTVSGTLVDMIDRYGFNQESTQAELDQLDAGASIGDFVTESWYDADGVVAVNYERFKTYFQSNYPDGDWMDIYEPDDNDTYQYACRRPRSTGGDPSGWLVKIKSDRALWRDLNPELPFDGGIIDPEGELGPIDDGRGDGALP